MNAMIVGIFLLLGICNLTTAKSVTNNTDSYLNTMQIIQKYGYPAEAHIVETSDGYLLTMHRIPGCRQSVQDSGSCKPKKHPVFMQHGLLSSSADFTLIGSNSLAFLLADEGYDVWLGNIRGNRYSRGHVSLFPDMQQFWNFTWHQSAIYDVSAQIDFVCNHTKQNKIVYIGYSMGTTMFFAMTSTLPKYNNKIEAAFLMAPVAFVKYIKSPLLRVLALISDNAAVIDELLASGEFLPNSKILKYLGNIFCAQNDIGKSLCMNAIFMITGNDPRGFDKNLLPTLINHYPSGCSIKTLNHYSQLHKSGTFRQYDYGKKKNMIEYGSLTPPDYNLSLINTPMFFYEGKNDYLATIRDNKHLAKELTTLKKVYVVDDPKFTHLDFLISINVTTLLYDTLINDLNSVLENQL